MGDGFGQGDWACRHVVSGVAFIKVIAVWRYNAHPMLLCVDDPVVEGLASGANDGELVVACDCAEDMTFEKWAFENRSVMFEDVMGVKPVLKTRREG